MPSTTASVLNSSKRSGAPPSSTAQSSPAPTTTDLLAGSERVKRLISSNSFMRSMGGPDLFLQQVEHDKVDRVERGVRANRREKVVRLFVKAGEKQRQNQQRQGSNHVLMEGGQDKRSAPPGQAW